MGIWSLRRGKLTPEHFYEFLRNIVFEEPIVRTKSALDPEPLSVDLMPSSSTLPQQHKCAGGNQQ